ncbi:MAG: PKD domain-containing protein [Caldithrix sp.]|nr:PKD domain-containing protein [Caldithrix sp.]
MKRISSIFLSLALFSSFLFAQQVKHKTVSMDNEDVPNFLGYDKQHIVIKLNNSLLDRIDKRRAAREAITGIEALDRLNNQFAAQSLIQKYPDLQPRRYQGRTIDPRLWFRISFKNEIDAERVARAYRRVSGIIDAQVIGIHKLYARNANDPEYGSQWHLSQSNDADVDAPEAWDIETGSDQIIVAILDTGVRYFHKDLGGADASYSNPEAARGNMWINEAEKNGADGVDDDGNGYVDDWIGWDFVDNKSGVSGEDDDVPDNDPRDYNGHGTHCSGIVAAINNNNYAVASPAGGWNNGSQAVEGNGVKIMPMRIGWSGRYFIFEVGYVDMGFAADALYYAADNGAQIASCSWGSSNSGGLGDAIDYFVASGGLVFKAAGNDDNEESDYMLDRSDVIGVASTDQNDVKSDFSTYGSFVDISAPGSDILSTYHDNDDPENDYTATLSGTSMSTPLTASVAALIWSQNPGWTREQVEQHLYATADDIYGISGNASYEGKLGAGRVNAFNAVNTGGGTQPPSAEFTADVTEGCAPLTVSFTDQSSGEIDSWNWDFGDGNTSTAQNPSHEYTSPGTYTVSLTVSGPDGSDTETKTDYITVYESITADFSGSPTSGEAPLNVSFTDQSTGDLSSWIWDFGDGGTSNAQNPSYEYTSAGTYTVTLSSSNSCDSDAETKTDYITVSEPSGSAPVADFSGTPTSGEAPLTVSFTDQSTNEPTSWSWDFGDGGTSTTQNPTYEYTSAGTYTVSLTATNDFGSDTETKTDYITVSEPAQQSMYVSALDVVKEAFWIVTRGSAEIRVVDGSGNPVSDATVTGSWSGSASDQDEVVTGSDGWATAKSSWVVGDGEFTFCVDNVTKSGWTYDEAANVVTCGSTDGSSSVVQVTDVNLEDIEEEIGFKMVFNSPNPFNPVTNINFYLPEASEVKLEIFNTLGQKVNTLVNGTRPGGLNTVRWNANDQIGNKVSSGFYFYQLTVDNKHKIQKKILLLK